MIKILVVVLLAEAALCAHVALSGDTQWCDENAERGKRYLYSVHHEANILPPFFVQETRVFPETSGSAEKKIVCITAYPEGTTSSAGTVEVINGGVGQYTVTLRFTSDLFNGINYRIQIDLQKD